MAVIENHTCAPHFWFEQTGPEGQPLDVLVLRATFNFANNDAPMQFAQEQQPIAFGDTFAGPIEVAPLRSGVENDGDLLPYKPGTDILVTGFAHAPEGRPQTDWSANVSVGKVKKALHLYGPRQFRKSWFGWRIGAANPVAKVQLDYRLAFGGCIEVPAALTQDGQPDFVKYSGNPAGCGWLPLPSTLKKLSKPVRGHISKWVSAQKVISAPQIEAEGEPIRNPYDHRQAQGLSAIARWWAPRLAHQGICDERWLQSRYPLLPEDFDSRFYQYAHPDLVAVPHLTGDERVTLEGLLPTRTEMRLPGWRLVAVIKRASGEISVTFPLLDTVRLQLDLGKASLVWRSNFECTDPVAEVSLAFTAVAHEGDRRSTTPIHVSGADQ